MYLLFIYTNSITTTSILQFTLLRNDLLEMESE